jgi:hypothetical protein
MAAEIKAAITNIPVGIGGERYAQEVLSAISAITDTFESRYREAIDPLLQAAGDNASLGGAFGGASFDAVQAAYERNYPDGLNLSDRIWQLGQEAKLSLTDALVDALANGDSVDDLAKTMMETLSSPGVDNLRYKAQRIARTEINRSYREGQIKRVTDEEGNLIDGVRAIGWRLSSSHPKPDICDWYASHDSGLGPGNYLPADVPSSHPQCTCVTVALLDGMDEEFQWNAPNPDAVPPGQLKYYGVG